MILHIFDSLLINKVGHCFEYAKSIYDEWRSRGLPAKVYCNIKAEKDIVYYFNATPLFLKDIYYVFSKTPIRSIINFLITNFLFLKDLKKIAPTTFSQTDIALFHTITHNQLLGLLIWYKGLPPKCRPVLVLLFVYANIIYKGTKQHFTKSFFAYKLIFKLFSSFINKHKIILAVGNEILLEEYNKLFKKKMMVFPFPISDLSYPNNTNEQKSATVIVYLGGARENKGYQLLPYLIRKVLHEHDNVQFVVQSNLQGHSSSQRLVLDAKELLETFTQHVTIIDKPLSTEEYYNILSQADLVLLPYSPFAYYKNTSGIFAEAIAFGKPVIATKNTWMEKQIREYNNCGISCENTVEALLEAINLFLKNKIEYKNKAKEAAAKWKKIHNVKTYVDMLVNIIKNEEK